MRRLRPADFRRPAFAASRGELWSVKDALAHITWWKLRMANALAGRRSMDPPAGSLRARNTLVWRRSHWAPPARVVAEHRAAHRAAVAILRALPASYFTGRARSATWPFDLVGHSAEHRRRHIDRVLLSR